MTYMLHFAPDNASLIIRLALEHRGVAYTTQLVDRANTAQRAPAYLTLNPNGLIPVLETPQGPLFETGAILLWLADQHGGLGPSPTSASRGVFLKWLFFISNTLHPALRMLFYPEKYIGSDHCTALQQGLAEQLERGFGTLETAATSTPDLLGGASPTVLDFYICGLLRWSALYPKDADRSWFDLNNYPKLMHLCAGVEALPACTALQNLEGLGRTPFTNPDYANPPIGSAT